MKRGLALALATCSILSLPAIAAEDSLQAALGGAVGGGLGALIGNELGGRGGAIVGGALGAATVTAVATPGPRRWADPPVHGRPVYRYDGDEYGRVSCPPGLARQGRCW